MDTASSRLVPAADKTIKIITHMAKGGADAYGVSELAAVLGYNKGTVQPILRTLVAAEWVQQDPTSGKYYLTNLLTQLSGQMEKQDRLINDFYMVASGMERQCGELINLHYLSGLSRARLMARVLSTQHTLRVELPVGAHIPVVASSAGKCLICNLDDTYLRQAFQGCSNHFTSSTIQSEAEFLDQVHTAYANGYATNNGEYEDGIYSIAAPVYNAQGRIVAAINIVIPAVRYTPGRQDSLIRLVKDGAKRLEQVYTCQKLVQHSL